MAFHIDPPQKWPPKKQNGRSFVAKSSNQLIKHKKKSHTKSLPISNQSKIKDLSGPKHSTRENSIMEIMHEDLTFIDVTNNTSVLETKIHNGYETDSLLIEAENINININLEENTEIPDNTEKFASAFELPLDNQILDNDKVDTEGNKNKIDQGNSNNPKINEESDSESEITKHNSENKNGENITEKEEDGLDKGKLVNEKPDTKLDNANSENDKSVTKNDKDRHDKEELDYDELILVSEVNPLSEGDKIQCPQCEYTTHNNESLSEHMKSTHYRKCSKCSQLFVNDDILSTHMKNIHIWPCDICNYKATNQDVLNKHMRSSHPGENVVICGECIMSFSSEVECNSHIKNCNIQKRNSNQIPIFPCDDCNQIYLNIKDLMNHKTVSHQVQTTSGEKLCCKPDNSENIKKLMEIRQYLDLYHNQLNIVQLDHTGVLVNLVENITAQKKCIETFSKEYKKLFEKVENIEKMLESINQNMPSKSAELSPPPLNKNPERHFNEESIKTNIAQNQNPQPKSSNQKSKKQNNFSQNVNTQNLDNHNVNNQYINTQNVERQNSSQKAKMLIVGTSLNKNLHPEVVKHVTDCDVTFATAYTVDRDDNAYWPDKNFLKIVPKELQKQNFDVLVMNAGPNEISNIDVSQNYSDNINDWKNKVAISSRKLYNLAEQCLNNYPSLRKVVIVKRIPRFDNKVKAHLSEYGNNILDELWMTKSWDKRIVVAKQDLYQDETMSVESYGDAKQPNYDGVHMRGTMAVPVMTRTFINMLTDIFPHLKNPRSSQKQKSYSQVSSQTQYYSQNGMISGN